MIFASLFLLLSLQLSHCLEPDETEYWKSRAKTAELLLQDTSNELTELLILTTASSEILTASGQIIENLSVSTEKLQDELKPDETQSTGIYTVSPKISNYIIAFLAGFAGGVITFELIK